MAIVINQKTRGSALYSSLGSPKGYRKHFIHFYYNSSTLKKKYKLLYDYNCNSYILYQRCYRYPLRSEFLTSYHDIITWSIIRTSKYCFRAIRTDYLTLQSYYISAKSAKSIIKKIQNYEQEI